MRDQAQFQKKLNERKMLEDKLRADAHQRPSEDTISDSDLMNEVGRLKKLSLKQKNELERYTLLITYSTNNNYVNHMHLRVFLSYFSVQAN